MFRVLTCLTGEHDWRLVLLAGLVCFVARIAAVNIFHRALSSHARTRLILVGIAFGSAALVVAVRYSVSWGTFVAALFLSLDIVSHDFTAMGAVEPVPDPTQRPGAASLSPTFLSLVIAGVALSVLGMSLI